MASLLTVDQQWMLPAATKELLRQLEFAEAYLQGGSYEYPNGYFNLVRRCFDLRGEIDRRENEPGVDGTISNDAIADTVHHDADLEVSVCTPACLPLGVALESFGHWSDTHKCDDVMLIIRDYDADLLTMGAVSGAVEAKHQSGLSDLSLGSYVYYRTVYGA